MGMRVVFMGTPAFAEVSLRTLLTHGTEVVGVFTQPDKPKGRGHKLTPPPVKELAESWSIPIFQPKSMRGEEAIEALRALAPDLVVVVAYGQILPKAVLEIPKKGCINLHASLLPAYRGAGPIQWSVLRGEKKTGVTTMYMAEGLDAGDMIFRAETEIGPDETSGELHDRLAEIGADLLVKTIDAIERDIAPRTPQEESQVSWAPMLDKGLSRIDFNKTAQEVHNLVRGLSPWPVAVTSDGGQDLKVYRTRIMDGCGKPGDVLDGGRLIVACAEGAVELVEVQRAGKRRVSGEEYLRGYHPTHLG